MTSIRRRSMYRIIANTFGTFGYLSVLLQWSWTLLIMCYPLIQSGTLQKVLIYNRAAEPAQSQPEIYTDAAPFIISASLVITGVIIAMTVIALFKLPKKVGQTGARLTHSAAKTIATATYTPQTASEKKQRVLSYKLVVTIKLALTLLPALLLLFTPSLAQLPRSVAYAVGNFCLVWSAVYWLLQYGFAKLFKIPREEIW